LIEGKLVSRESESSISMKTFSVPIVKRKLQFLVQNFG